MYVLKRSLVLAMSVCVCGGGGGGGGKSVSEATVHATVVVESLVRFVGSLTDIVLNEPLLNSCQDTL